MPAPKPLKIEIARPCPVSWEAMAGDERTRFCAICQKCVYNLSAMTLPEARALIAESEGPMCVRVYQRADGTVMTSDCGFGLERVRRSVRRGVGAFLGLMGTALTAVFGIALFGDNLRRMFRIGAGYGMGALAAPLDPPRAKRVQGHAHGAVIFPAMGDRP